MRKEVLAAAVLLAAFTGAPRAVRSADPEARTPNEFLARGTPTFVRGTAGDPDSDRRVAAQVDLLRGMLFPTSAVVDDDSVDVARGPDAWPRNPVLFGGPHVNSVLRRLEPSLPFRLEPGRLVVGERTFQGDEHRVVAVVPSRAREGDTPGHPTFLVYAGAGTPGVTEINSVPHGGDGLLVADRFGPLLRGRWATTTGGGPALSLAAPLARPEWTTTGSFAGAATPVARALTTASEGPGEVDPAALLPGVHRAMASRRGVERAFARLGSHARVVPMTLYFYASAERKREVTGRAGDGHADMASRTLHVRTVDDEALENLVAHEATHVLADAAWGPPGTPLLGEGLAVWAAGSYGRRPLAEWRARLAKAPRLADLLGPKFRATLENVSYPAAGLLVEGLVETVGVERLREHLYPATATGWAAACVRAGTTAEAVEKAWRARLEAK